MFQSRKVIHCENPQEWLWEQLVTLDNEYMAKKHLQKSYQQMGVEQPAQLAFLNVPAFCSYLRQGRALIFTQSLIENWIEPITLYYGLMNLIKAWLICIDPSYPQQTSLLRHGCTTRKKKRRPFSFLQDEIRLQKEGLLPYLFKRLDLIILQRSYTPEFLFGQLPDLAHTYHLVTGYRSFYPMKIIFDDDHHLCCIIPEKILDRVHLSLPSWFLRFCRCSTDPMVHKLSANIKQGSIVLRTENTFHHNENWTMVHPWVYQNRKGDHYLWVDNDHLKQEPLPELCVIYLLLFSLGMLARYDSPLWKEVLTDSAEGALLPSFFSLVKRKLPQIIWEQLHHERIQFVLN